MTRRARWAIGVGVLLLVLPTTALSWQAWYIANPRAEVNPLPPALFAEDSPEGQVLPASAETMADRAPLTAALQSQETRTGCGAATAATVLTALRGVRVSQDDVYSPAAVAVRSKLRTFFTGMPLGALESTLQADGATAVATHAGDVTVGAFREVVARNSATPGDFLVVNYLRSGVGQEGGGHFSPIGAYDAATDRVLILDVATLRYPPVWAPLTDLFAAMDTTDPESGLTRGWIEVR